MSVSFSFDVCLLPFLTLFLSLFSHPLLLFLTSFFQGDLFRPLARFPSPRPSSYPLLFLLIYSSLFIPHLLDLIFLSPTPQSELAFRKHNPDGDKYQNCILIREKGLLDTDCKKHSCSACHTTAGGTWTLRGTCEEEEVSPRMS